MRYGIVFTMVVGATKHHVVEAFINDVPEDVKVSEVTESLGNSNRAPEFSERGIFLANRKVLAESRIPKGANASDAKEIEWKALGRSGSVQVNMRVPVADRAAWELAAGRAGESLSVWARRVLNDGAKGSAAG